MSAAQPPRRAVEVVLQIGADSWEHVSRALLHYAMRITAEGRLSEGCSGGPDWGDTRSVREDPSMTHERYFAELSAHLACLSADGEAGTRKAVLEMTARCATADANEVDPS